MKIELKDFGGIIPGTDPASLPDNAAQIAQNVDLSAGTIKPWETTNEFTALHNDDGTLADGVSPDDIAILPQPDKVAIVESAKMCHPEQFVDIFLEIWHGYTPYGTSKCAIKCVAPFTISNVSYTDTGVKLSGKFELPAVKYQRPVWSNDYGYYNYSSVYLGNNCPTGWLSNPGSTSYFGPFLKIGLTPTVTNGFAGGPDKTHFFPYRKPDESSNGSTDWYHDWQTGGGGGNANSINLYAEEKVPSSVTAPIFFPMNWDNYSEADTENSATSDNTPFYQYGVLELIDTGTLPKMYITKAGQFMFAIGDRAPDYQGGEGMTSECWFEFSCNYTRNTRQQAVYIQQAVDSEGRDGPESDESDIVTLDPGDFLKLNPNRITGYDHSIFRAAYGSRDFYKIGKNTGGYFYDDFMRPLTDQLPPNGALPFATATSAVRGAVKHPAGYAVYFQGNELRPSSEWIERERPWAAPKEYAYAFDSNIKRIALSGGAVLVFTERGVFTATGQHPARLSIYRISDKPMQNRLSLWQSGNMVGWVNEEGLCVYDGGSEILLTGEYYRADEWQLLNPEVFEAKVNDRSICLFGNDARLRFDFRGDRIRAISLFDESEENRREFRWRSKIFQTPPVLWYAARIDAVSYPVLLSLYGDDGKFSEDVLVLDNNDFLLPRMQKSRSWFFELRGACEIRSVAISTNRRELL